MKRKAFEQELRKLQVQLCHLQEWVKAKGLRPVRYKLRSKITTSPAAEKRSTRPRPTHLFAHNQDAEHTLSTYFDQLLS